MRTNKVPVYFIPGMAAGSAIFDKLTLPEDSYDVAVIEWIIPLKDESLTEYAKRMAKFVIKPQAVLIGVSFGGVVAQEMSEFLNLRELIIISSVKTKFEMPKRMHLVSSLRLYKILPVTVLVSTPDLTKFAVGPKSRKRLQLYNTYLSMRDKRYIKWAVKHMLGWNRKTPVASIKHIHGDKDIVFPIKNISQCTVIKEGTHVMILFKAQELTQTIIKLIDKSKV